jgi:hypothetical protein
MPLFDTHPLTHPCIPSQPIYPNGRPTFRTRSTTAFSDTQEASPPRDLMRQLVRPCLYVMLWKPSKDGRPSAPNSRLKKIKCVQVKSLSRCEACEAGNTPCQFRDRERYFAERSRIVTGASAGPSPAHSRRSSTQSIEPSAVSPTRGDSADASGWYSGAQASSDSGHPSRYASSSPSYSLSSSPQSNPDQWFSSPLMGSARPHYER